MDILAALGFCMLLTAATGLGFKLRGVLPEEHLSERNMEAVRLVTSLMVTFAALVLSLQLSSVKASFDKAYRDRNADAAQLVQLDQCLRNYGPETAPIREKLRSYTAAVIASTWPDEARPDGIAYPDTKGMARQGESATLSDLVGDIGLAVNRLEGADALRRNIAAECRATFVSMQALRWSVIEDASTERWPLFTGIVTVWLMLVFLSFGLQAPRKLLAAVVLVIGIVSISSVMFVIADLTSHYGGLFGIPSRAMRLALAAMSR